MASGLGKVSSKTGGVLMSKGFISFEKNGYIPTSVENCRKYSSHRHDYGFYLNNDIDIAENHIEAFYCHSERELKILYEKQKENCFASSKKYPNAPFIIFKKNKEKDERT